MEYLNKSFSVGGYGKQYADNFDAIFGKKTNAEEARPKTEIAAIRGLSIYTASKTIHAPRWRAIRESGIRVCSTWIDEAGPGETKDIADLWVRCIREAASADALILFRADETEELKGALAEVGAALAMGKPVFWVGPIATKTGGGYTCANHPLVVRCKDVEEALEKLSAVSREP